MIVIKRFNRRPFRVVKSKIATRVTKVRETRMISRRSFLNEKIISNPNNEVLTCVAMVAEVVSTAKRSQKDDGPYL